MLQVIEIVRKLRRGTRNVAGVSEMDLCPTSNSRLQEEASTPKRNLSFKKSEILRTFRPWSDNTHFTPEDVPELWKLIQARLSKDATDPRYTRISLRGPDRSSSLCVRDHCPELDDLEGFATFSAAGLPVENRPIGATKCDPDHDEEREEDEEGNGRHGDVKSALR
jgi:hypothetical protein